ncbi:chemotaxis protein CheA [Kordiimonas pumila]|uniref:Chemotaxis protein CheA n=1 Tax=Kordiimonas pumila TaxID=2161677 RepID=A0ABV7D269_9PROT|nr:chemotaxis protein CheA [Kordiimonas pumila]
MSGSSDDPFLQFKLTFFEECNELLSDVEQYLADLETGDFSNETLHAIFRAVHSIKAGAGAFSFERMVNFTHKFETFLDELRTSRLEVGDSVVETLFRGFDVLSDLVEFAQKDEIPDPLYGQEALDAIEAFLGDPASAPAPIVDGANTEKPLATPGDKGDTRQHFRIEFTPKEAMYRHANEPLLIIRELRDLGELSLTIDTSRLPPFEALEPEDAYFSWVMDLVTDKGRDEIDEVFEFVIDDCDLTIVTLGAGGSVVSVDVSHTRVDDDGDDFGFFVDDAALEAGQMSAGEANVAAPEAPVVPEVTVVAAPAKAPQGIAIPKDTEVPSDPVAQQNGANQPRVGSIRVDIDRVDRLVNMVGELVITQSMLAQEVNSTSHNQNSRVETGMEELSMHIRELQENVMAIRMQPVKSVFSRMPRIVRDVSKKLDKKIRLVTIGEATEVDKTVIEELADPLIHMIRNSMDHGLETPAERLAAGKSEEGTIRLSAEHRGGRILIEVVDDGRGINRKKVLELAKQKGVVPADAQLTDDEIDNLIFAPGFSTAEEVTDLSGRGVGMDVVRRNIQSLGGRVSVQSHPGHGTRFQLTLPLTLAVLDGMIVGVGDHKYVVPINSIVETVRPIKADVDHLVDGNMVMRVRGKYLRIVPVAKIFQIEDSEPDPSKGLVVLVEADGGSVVGLLVDYLLGQQQVVIKSLETNFRAVDGIASATILGDGSVCLILDVDRMATMDVPVSVRGLSRDVGYMGTADNKQRAIV